MPKYLVAGFGSRWWWYPGGPPFPLKVWEVAHRRLIRLDGHTGFCMSLDFSKDGKLLASGSRDGTAILWSTATWTRAQTLHNPDHAGRGFVEGVAFSPDGKTLAMASVTGNVHLWDVASGKLLETLKGHSSAVFAVVFSPDGHTLASGGTDHTVRLWNVETRRQLMQLDPGSIEWGDMGVMTLAFSPDGKQLLVGGRGGSAVWSAAPIVWNDPARAAEKLHVLLQSNADFLGRIGMLSEHARLDEALEKLENLAPNDVRVQIALAVARSRRFAAQGDAALAEAARTKARLLLEQLLKQHPQAAAGLGDLYAAEKDWEQAIAEYRKLVTSQPADGALLTKLAAAYQRAGRTREAVPYLARTAAANPDNTLLFGKVAALQAWFGQDKELAATCRWGLALAKNSSVPETADRVAKACCLLPSTDKAPIEAALALARQAVQLGKDSPNLPWFQMALGMAEYRSGHFAEADAALIAAAKGVKDNPHLTGTSAFYRAMSLFRQGKQDEARTLAVSAAATMKPLPKDEKNPLAGDASADDLILWLAYKEAKDLIKFDAAPPARPENGKK
jgi:tetratricopeptide (TPR) repeat protein